MTVATSAIIGIVASLGALAFALYLTQYILRQDYGSDRVQELSEYIQKGARTFMLREFKVLSIFVVVVAIALWFAPSIESVKAQGWQIALGFVLGTVASGLAGWIGMSVATQANGRTANAAQNSFSKALNISYSGGATMGFSVVGLGLLGLSLIYYVFPGDGSSHIWLGYAFGASGVALFLRVGGGIYTKAADVGADVVGKVEAGIPEDDPRNPAVIADNVGDNVGDVAGMGSDLYESFVSAVAATMVLGIGVKHQLVDLGVETSFHNLPVYFPLILASAGIVASVIGALFVRTGGEEEDYEKQARKAQSALNRGSIVANVLIVVFAVALIFLMFPDGYIASEAIKRAESGLNLQWALIISIVSGLITGVVIGYATQYYTSDEYSPVQSIAEACSTGAATNIIEGLGTGMVSTVIPAISVGAATLIAFHFAGLYGIALASLGMLLTLGVVLAMDAYGPITDNAAGIAEMANLGEEVRGRCEALDSVGNTTAAIGKGFAIGSAALAALAWLATFFHEAETVEALAAVMDPSLINPAILVGLILGSMLTFYLSALGIHATSEGAGQVVKEVRRQFDEIDGVREGERDPDYNRCVDITTTTAIQKMMLPGIVVLISPIVIGSIPGLGINAVAGMLAGVLVTGFLMAVFMSNAGGAWDNAKKYIESGEFGGKGSPAHKASVVGDTVGDPLKDTSGPSLNVLIKLMGKVAVIFLPFFAAVA
ncbi:MAG: sodium-translocating pyrophosphatase [bacterium]